MKNIVIFICLLLPALAFSQGETAVPFLLITSAPDANGMGGISATLPSENAMATISNPGQLGLQSLDSYAHASFYAPTTGWLPGFQQYGMSYYVSALNLGIDLRKAAGISLPLSIGFGYSRVHMNLGRYTITGGSPIPMEFEAQDNSQNFSLAIGLDYVVRLGAGITYKSIESTIAWLDPPGRGPVAANVPAYDLGILMDIPAFDIASRLSGNNVTLFKNTQPLFDIMTGYSLSNYGNDKLIYMDHAQEDPLPRKGTLGLNVKVGLSSQTGFQPWEYFSFTFAREAEDVLVSWSTDTVKDNNGGIVSISDPHYVYQGLLGDLNFFDNVIKSEGNGNVWLRRGWQLNLGEVLYLRGGSVNAPGLQYTTSGFSFRMRGIFHLIETLNTAKSLPLLDFVAVHFDLQYDHSSESSEGPRNGTTYNGLTVILK